MLVMPPQMLLYMALAPEQKLTYKEGGPAAEARFEAGLAGFEARSFRGCGVMTSEPFEVSDDNESLQMLYAAAPHTRLLDSCHTNAHWRLSPCAARATRRSESST